MSLHLDKVGETVALKEFGIEGEHGEKAVSNMKNNRKFLCDILKQLNAQLQNKVKPFKVKFYLLKEKAILTSGDSFGEYALISNKERNATVYARSP